MDHCQEDSLTQPMLINCLFLLLELEQSVALSFFSFLSFHEYLSIKTYISMVFFWPVRLPYYYFFNSNFRGYNMLLYLLKLLLSILLIITSKHQNYQIDWSSSSTCKKTYSATLSKLFKILSFLKCFALTARFCYVNCRTIF